MDIFDLGAWSIYTGPSNLHPILNDSDCSWVVGTWDGINNDCSVGEIQKDIDSRVDLIVKTCAIAFKELKTPKKFFVIPEFFFKCKEGPYPFIEINGLYPVEYIENTLKEKLGNMLKSYGFGGFCGIAVGSILTSNICDYGIFLNSDKVLERMAELNECLSDTLKNRFKLNSENKGVHKRWHRQPSFMKSSTNLKESPELEKLNAFMKQSRSNPLCTVRNRGIFFAFDMDNNSVESYIYEKQNESTVDLTMGIFNTNNNEIEHGGMITEWMANYPSISIVDGDKNAGPYSGASRIDLDYFKNQNPSNEMGIEICLDHRKQRLRRTVDMTQANGASSDNYPLFLQVIPSGGMQILDYSVSACSNGIIFNSDGCDKIYVVYGKEDSAILDGETGEFTGITCGAYTKSFQSKWLGNDGNYYYSHSQIATATDDSKIGGFNNALGLNNPKALTYKSINNEFKNEITDSFIIKNINFQFGKNGLFGVPNSDIHIYNYVQTGNGLSKRNI